MNYLIVLMPIMLAFLVLTAVGLIWAVRSNQFDDVDSPAHRILFDQDIVPLKEEEERKEISDATVADKLDKLEDKE